MTSILRGQHGIRFAKLTPAQCARLDEAVLEILWDVGVELNHPAAVALLAGAGATVEGNRVRIPASLVRWAIDAAPGTIVLHDRTGEPVMPAGEDRVFFGCGSETPFILDHRTWERRHGTLADVAEGARVIQALPNFDFLMSLFLPWDLDPKIAYLHQYRAMLEGCTKPMLLVTPSPADVPVMMAMQEAVVGDAAERIARPRAMVYVNVTNPLRQEHEELEKALYCAEHHVPFAYIAPVLPGLMGPVTYPGSTVLSLAGELAGVVVAQLAREGAAIAISGGITGVMDMKSMITSYAAPEDRIVSGEMARYYGLPHFGLGGSTDSKLIDGQATAEAALTLFTEALVGSNIIHDVGYTESGTFNCLTQLVICDELISWVRAVMQPLQIDDITLPMDVIKERGIGGDYVTSDHTMEHFGDVWYPSLFDRRKYDKWAELGGKDLTTAAAEKVETILAKEPAEPLAPEVQEELASIIAEETTRRGL
ncbi:MAG: trimethylamine methyltransferase family protein [Thermoleophilia bacterium]